MSQQQLQPFALERYFACHEFSAPHLLCCSDSEPLSLQELLLLADDECLQLYHSLTLSYTQSQGLPALRAAIAHHLYSSISPQNIVIAAPQEILTLTMQAVLHPGDTVIVQYPGYQSLYEIATSIGCNVIYWQLEEIDDVRDDSRVNVLSFDVSKLVSLITTTTKPKMVVVNFPHNPTGYLPTLQQWQSIVEACRSTGTLLFSDEMYRTLELDGVDNNNINNGQTRLPSAADMYSEGGISLGGLSKSVGLPGLRVGWIACHNNSSNNKIIERILELKDYSSICTAAPSEVLALIGVRNWEGIVKRQLAIIQKNIVAFEVFLKKWQHVIVLDYVPKAGTICFPRILLTNNDSSGKKEVIDEWCERCVKESGVLLLPATVYGSEPSIQAGRVRIGYGRKNFSECLGYFEEWLEKEVGNESKVGRYLRKEDVS